MTTKLSQLFESEVIARREFRTSSAHRKQAAATITSTSTTVGTVAINSRSLHPSSHCSPSKDNDNLGRPRTEREANRRGSNENINAQPNKYRRVVQQITNDKQANATHKLFMNLDANSVDRIDNESTSNQPQAIPPIHNLTSQGSCVEGQMGQQEENNSSFPVVQITTEILKQTAEVVRNNSGNQGITQDHEKGEEGTAFGKDKNDSTEELQRHSKIVQILFKDEYLVSLNAYILNNMSVENQNHQFAKQIWAQILVHMIRQIFVNICCTSFSDKDERFEKFNSLPRDTPLSKKIVLSELYNDYYNIEIHGYSGMHRMAVHPNRYYNRTIKSKANIVCHICADGNCDKVAINLFNYGELESFESFYNKLNSSLHDIIAAYFDKINQFYLFEPSRELRNFTQLILETQHIGIKTGRGNILLNMASVRHLMSENELISVKSFMKKWKPLISLQNDGVALTKCWAKLCVDFVVDMLTKAFALSLNENRHELQFDSDAFSRAFDVTGFYDIFDHRGNYGPKSSIHYGFLFRELLKTSTYLRYNGRQFNHPFRAIFHIWVDTTNFNLISIDIYNLRSEPYNDPIKTVTNGINAWNPQSIHILIYY